MAVRKSESAPRIPMSDDKTAEAAIKAFQEVAAADPESRAMAGRTLWNQQDADYLTAAMNSPGGWMYGPAMLNLFVAAVNDLGKLGVRLLGTNNVERIRACVIEGTKHVYIVPTRSDDLTGIKVNRYSDQTWINLVKLLAPVGIRVKSGYRERYDLTLVEEGPVGPALFMDMSQMQERRRVKKSTAKKAKQSTPKGKQAEPNEQ